MQLDRATCICIYADMRLDKAYATVKQVYLNLWMVCIKLSLYLTGLLLEPRLTAVEMPGGQIELSGTSPSMP